MKTSDNIFHFSNINNGIENLVCNFSPQESISLDLLHNIDFNPMVPIASMISYNQSVFISPKYGFLENLGEMNDCIILNVLTFNIRSVLANLQLFLDVSFHKSLHSLCESRLGASIEDLYRTPGHHLIHQPQSPDGVGWRILLGNLLLAYFSFILLR